MKIQDIKMGKINTPLKQPYKVGKKIITMSDEIVIKIVTDTGEVGYGSAAPTPSDNWGNREFNYWSNKLY